ncbi:MAG: hypothetical protein KGZ58_02225 [Ignavibacteriales bacterium]|nr:hypothetical protein [Ignavibacteriales bacterium]
MSFTRCWQANWSFVICSLFLLSVTSVRTQTETDSLNENNTEQLLEQTETEESESPILEDISDSLDENETENLHLEIRSRVGEELQQREGYNDGMFLGSRVKSYQRFKASQGNFFGGVLLEKDAGEQKANDFTTGFLQAKNIFNVLSVIVGNYRVEHGQGLSLWRGYDVSKGGAVLSPSRRHSRSIIPHLSSDEVNFFRGVAITIDVPQFHLSFFISRKQRDATIDTSQNTASMYSTGYFRTQNEIGKRNALTESTIGSLAKYNFSENISFGGNVYRSKFDKTVIVREGNLFSGIEYSSASLSFDARISKAKMFGEVARTNNNTNAKILGTQFSPLRKFSFVVVWRSYAENFFALHGLGFGERTETSNENGVYVGCSFLPMKRTKVSFYFDQFSFPKPIASTIFASNGNDALLRFDIHATEQTSLSLQTQRKKTIQQTTTDINSIATKLDAEQIKQRYRFTLDSRTENGFTFRNRIEFVSVTKEYVPNNETGFLIYADVGKKLTRDVSANFRVAFYQTDSFESRIAAFEKEVTGALSVPALYGKGIRWYVFLQWNILENFSLQTKYTSSFRDDVKFIGSGENQFPTNSVNTITMQADWTM